MPVDGVFDRRGAAVVQERPPQPQTPQRRRPDLVGRWPWSRFCLMPSPVPMLCRSRSEKSGTTLRLKSGLALGPVVSAGMWHAAQPIAAKTRSPSRTVSSMGPRAIGASSLMNDGEVVDVSPARDADRLCLRGRRSRSHSLSRLGRDAEGELEREDVVGNPHLVAVRVAGEGEERRDLRLPAKPADAAFARRRVDDDRRPAGAAVAVAIERVGQRQQRLVGNRFDQARAKERNRHAPRDDVGVGRQRPADTHGSGRENVWNSVSPDASSARNVPSGSRWPARTSAIGLIPPIAGTLWHAPQLVPLNAGPSPSSTVSTPVNAVQTQAEQFELARGDAGERIAGPRRGVELSRSAARPGATSHHSQRRAARALSRHQSSTIKTPCMKS